MQSRIVNLTTIDFLKVFGVFHLKRVGLKRMKFRDRRTLFLMNYIFFRLIVTVVLGNGKCNNIFSYNSIAMWPRLLLRFVHLYFVQFNFYVHKRRPEIRFGIYLKRDFWDELVGN